MFYSDWLRQGAFHFKRIGVFSELLGEEADIAFWQVGQRPRRREKYTDSLDGGPCRPAQWSTTARRAGGRRGGRSTCQHAPSDSDGAQISGTSLSARGAMGETYS